MDNLVWLVWLRIFLIDGLFFAGIVWVFIVRRKKEQELKKRVTQADDPTINTLWGKRRRLGVWLALSECIAALLLIAAAVIMLIFMMGFLTLILFILPFVASEVWASFNHNMSVAAAVCGISGVAALIVTAVLAFVRMSLTADIKTRLSDLDKNSAAGAGVGAAGAVTVAGAVGLTVTASGTGTGAGTGTAVAVTVTGEKAAAAVRAAETVAVTRLNGEPLGDDC